MKIVNLATVAVITIITSSCEGYRSAIGTVVDKESRKPIHGAAIHNVADQIPDVITDTCGMFRINNSMGGYMPCKDITISISKPGYNEVIITNPSLNTTTGLEKQQ